MQIRLKAILFAMVAIPAVGFSANFTVICAEAQGADSGSRAISESLNQQIAAIAKSLRLVDVSAMPVGVAAASRVNSNSKRLACLLVKTE